MLYREFEFVNNGSGFVPLLQQMLRYINQYVKLPAGGKKQVLFQSKVVLTELLTNAIKHSGTERTTMRIAIGDDCISLIKTDAGTPLNLLYRPDMAEIGNTVTLSRDAFHILQAVTTSKNKISFTYTELIPAGLPELTDIAEHFGLLLILKTAQQLTYVYEAGEGLNVFTAKLLFE